MLRDVGLHERHPCEGLDKARPVKRILKVDADAGQQHEEGEEELLAALAVAGGAFPEEPVGVGAEAKVEDHEGKRHPVRAGVGSHLENGGALPLAGREGQPGKSAQQPGAGPLDDDPDAREPHHGQQAGEVRLAQHSRQHPPGRQIPDADPEPHKGPEQEEPGPGDMVQPAEQDRPGDDLRGQQGPGKDFQAWTPVGPDDPRHQHGVGELRRLERRERRQGHEYRQCKNHRGNDTVPMPMDERRLRIVRIDRRRF